jgi:hypothetical protein
MKVINHEPPKPPILEEAKVEEPKVVIQTDVRLRPTVADRRLRRL